MAPGGQRGEGREDARLSGAGAAEREPRPCQELGGGAPPHVRIPSGRAVEALRGKPDLPPFFLTALTKGSENPPEMRPQPPPAQVAGTDP